MILLINEIFYSLQGETLTTGLPSVFIRLTKCNLRCKFCDTKSSYVNGTEQSIDEIISEIKKYPSLHHVTITGGEPLLQKNTIFLIKRILEENYKIQIETNGSLDISKIPKKARKIVDIKTPSSTEEDSFLHNNIKFLSENDEIKFVISDKKDYNFSVNFINRYLKNTKATINFSPAYKTMNYKELSNLILEDNLKVRLNLQLHKIVNFK